MAGHTSGNLSLTCEFCFETIFPDDSNCSFCGKGFDKEELLINIISGKDTNTMNRYKSLGLRLRGAHFDETEVRSRIQLELDRPSCLSGYRSVWHTLRHEGFTIPRHSVEILLREMDPDGCELRRRHQLQRRTYVNPRPNFCWHTDGYDKLKPYGFPIHACIDVFSCKVLWLGVTQTNNDPVIVARSYLGVVKEMEDLLEKFDVTVELKMVY